MINVLNFNFLFFKTVQQNEEGHIWFPYSHYRDCDTHYVHSIVYFVKYLCDQIPRGPLSAASGYRHES